ncbi:hypothetical protein FXO38_36691 [Capsicum annuum]|nr:hypothetical protein FXO38_36691 [Capsicum annuum]KAF3646044.1 hypothetical protein FXO37_20663 [Capsicum annuum]
MDYFQFLPEGCISEILSLTSPKGDARSSAVSQTFMSAAESDVVWEYLIYNFIGLSYKCFSAMHLLFISLFLAIDFKDSPEVAYLANARSLDIHGRIGAEMLSPKTDYAAYLVFKLARKSYGLEYANSVIRFVNYESETKTEEQANIEQLATLPKMRGDAWMEVELGYFNNMEGSDGPVEVKLIEIKHLVAKVASLLEELSFA